MSGHWSSPPPHTYVVLVANVRVAMCQFLDLVAPHRHLGLHVLDVFAFGTTA